LRLCDCCVARCTWLAPRQEITIEDGGLLACQDLALEDHLSDVKPVAKEISERAACEGNATNGLPCLQGPHLGDDAPVAQVRHQQVEAAKVEIAAEDGPDAVSFSIIDGDLSVLRVIAERRHATDPKTLALGGGDLVPDAL
jgi:hypothetical protein